MKKSWTNFEFDLIVDKAIDKRRKIFAVWHRVNLHQVKRFSRYLSMSTALRSELGIEEIADRLVVLIKGPLYQKRKRQTKQFKRARKAKSRRSR
jgi:hypothetical protein